MRNLERKFDVALDYSILLYLVVLTLFILSIILTSKFDAFVKAFAFKVYMHLKNASILDNGVYTVKNNVSHTSSSI